MDADAKKHTLRLVPYGLYLAGAKHADGSQSINLVSWFTQVSFNPCRVILGLHREGSAFAAAQETKVLSLNILGEGQGDVMKGFYKHVDVTDGKAGELDVTTGPETGCPLLPALPASLELKLVEFLEGGDHAPCLFEVVNAHIHDAETGAMTHAEVGLHYAG